MGGHLIGTLLTPRGLARPWRCLSGLRQATRVHLLPSDPGPRYRHCLPFSGAASVIAPLQLSSARLVHPCHRPWRGGVTFRDLEPLISGSPQRPRGENAEKAPWSVPL